MSRRVITAINWPAMVERVEERQKPLFTLFKAKSDQYLHRMTAYPEEQPKINWAFYKSSIPIPGLVDKFQKEYEALSIPYPVDNYTSLVDTQEKETNVEIEKYIQDVNKQIAELQATYEKRKNLIPYEEMTAEEMKDAIPEAIIDLVERPTFWPHRPEDKPGPNPSYVPESH